MLILHTPVPVCGDKWLITHFLYVPEHTGFSLGCNWGGGGGVIEGLIGTQEILSTREKTQTQAREFNDFNAHRARDSINTDQELHWNNAAASLNGNAFIIPSKNREQQNNAFRKMKTKTSFKHHKYTSLLCVYDKLCA